MEEGNGYINSNNNKLSSFFRSKTLVKPGNNLTGQMRENLNLKNEQMIHFQRAATMNLGPQMRKISIIPEVIEKKILIAEDSEFTLFALEGMLKSLGVDYDVAKDGAKAVELAINGNYSLILMDIEMPILSGIEATVEIRKQRGRESKGRVPIIAATGHDQTDIHEKCYKSGMDSHSNILLNICIYYLIYIVTKPIRKDFLKELLKKYNIIE